MKDLVCIQARETQDQKSNLSPVFPAHAGIQTNVFVLTDLIGHREKIIRPDLAQRIKNNIQCYFVLLLRAQQD